MKYRVTRSGECKTYAALHHTAWHLLDHAKRYEEGRLLHLQACAVFCAFTFEAYLNHVGEEEIGYWNEIERIAYRSKLAVIAGHLHFQLDVSQRPFQTIIELFRLRDTLAHGRTAAVHEVFEASSPPPYDSVTRVMPWEKLTPEQLERYYGDVEAAIVEVNATRKPPDQFLWDQGGRSRVVEESTAPNREQSAPPNVGSAGVPPPSVS